jgi:hypothetical protein
VIAHSEEKQLSKTHAAFDSLRIKVSIHLSKLPEMPYVSSL